MDHQLQTILEDAGFTEKEAAVYLALLELSEANVTELSEKTNLKRSIIYVLLEGLIKRGYASEIPNQKINRYQAADPSKILFNLQGLTKSFKEMLPLFKGLYNKNEAKPKIHYFENQEAIINVFRSINESQEAYFFSSINKLRKFIPEEVDAWVSGMRNNIYRLEGYHLIENNPEDIAWGKKVQGFNQEIRLIDKTEIIDMDLSIFDGKVALTSIQEDKLHMVLIESEFLFNSMKLMHKYAWKSARPLE